MLDIDSLNVVYPNGLLAVRALSLRVRQGEIFGLLGLNGAGKSSLIKTIATLMRPASGRIHIGGLDARREPAKVKRCVGVMPQENNLDTFLNVRQNLLFHCLYAGMPLAMARGYVEDWLAYLDMAGKKTESVLRLSGGSKRKIMLAKAFITEPQLLVLDEPTPGLDPGIRAWFWQRIRQFRAAGGTVFLSTHYLEEAAALCDRVGILHRGRLIELIDTASGISDGLAAAFSRATGGEGSGGEG